MKFYVAAGFTYAIVDAATHTQAKEAAPTAIHQATGRYYGVEDVHTVRPATDDEIELDTFNQQHMKVEAQANIPRDMPHVTTRPGQDQ